MDISNIDSRRLDEMKLELKNCPTCRGSGVDCLCLRNFKFEIQKAQAHIPIKYRNFTFDSIDSPEAQTAKEIVLQYTNALQKNYKEGRGLLLFGTTYGTGKSTLGNLVLMEALKHGYSAYATDLDECIQLVTQGWGDSVKRHDLTEIIEKDFILFDDIGGNEVKTRGNAEFLESNLTIFFRKRYHNLLPTIITTNLEPAEMRLAYGERLYSAMCECLLIVECKGPDYRQLEK